MIWLGLTVAWCVCGKGKQDPGRASRPPADSLAIELAGASGYSVLELLRREHEVEARETVTGAFVIAIDSVENGQGYFWVYSVNDSMPRVACDRYITGNGDVVRWHFRKMD